LAEGDTVVTVKDSKGQSASSYKIYVGKPSSGGGGGEEPPPPGGGGDGSCPIGDQSLCDIMCQVKPELPFCNK
jgi:thermitase